MMTWVAASGIIVLGLIVWTILGLIVRGYYMIDKQHPDENIVVHDYNDYVYREEKQVVYMLEEQSNQ